MPEPGLVADAWLAFHLGKPCFHLTGDVARIGGCGHELAGRLAAPRIFVDAKVDVSDTATVGVLQSLGFHLIETAVRFTAPRGACLPPASADVGFATPDMAAAVGGVAERSFMHDRFHRDPAIPAATANAVKRGWALNYFAGKRGDWMVVARRDGRPVGFLQLLRSPADDLVIDLIAVDRDHRGGGLARAMIAFAAANCPGGDRLVVGTQIANAASVRLYEGMGFRFEAAYYVLHHHGGSSC
jgi:ribosomal protein S18 acetylase RimI-like enzyme